MITVFLVDDHEVVRQGVAALLDAEDDMEVVGGAGTVTEALARIPALAPRVAVLDVRLPDGTGIELCRELRSRMDGLACLMLTSYTDERAMFDAVLAGAAGYVIKDVRGNDIVNAVREVGSGRTLLDGRAASVLMDRLRTRTEAPDPLAELTGKEREVLGYIGDGLTNREIGAQMFLAEKTVKNYVSALLAKLGMQRRVQAAVLADRVRAERARTELE
ncbi:LuxR family two component transcriptional regulator [Actinomycetospora succinea]|uniref:LuxR family two component transcriptional regulator n=1 Tax=Actinomycetospora succinea TaxID=663603 RepID=A0A4R6ULJ2_9PSEU|nr:response regulator transcription factor [Actinomycetospora succinea]TDQ47046.1 LuxR family two component transcriptional regulator [Actinomycetospora succinea]